MTLWFLTRSTALVSFALLTATTVLGVATARRAWVGPRWPRFANQLLHRNLSLIGLVLMVVHVVTAIADSYVPIGWWALFIPGASSYRTLGVALGTLTLDLLLTVVATSLLRGRIVSVRTWRRVHWAAYGAWPLALLHFLFTGTDGARDRWGLWLAYAALAAVATAVVARTADRPRSTAEDRRRARSTVRSMSWAISAGAVAASAGLTGAFAGDALPSSAATNQTSTTSTTSSSTEDSASSTSTAPQSTGQPPVTQSGGS